jgi:hypothetical protein
MQFVVGLGDKVSPTDIEEGMRVGYVILYLRLQHFRNLNAIWCPSMSSIFSSTHVSLACCFKRMYVWIILRVIVSKSVPSTKLIKTSERSAV